jgi:hypothetical protein
MSVDYAGALDMLLPTDYSFSSVAPIAIVCHKTGGDAHVENVQNTFLATRRSTHFAVDTDGRVAQYVPLSRGAGGNCCPDRDNQGNLICDPFWFPLVAQYGNLNFCTISIEHCDPTGDNSYPMPQAQIDASNRLIKWLCDRYGIGTDHILGHRSINPVQKASCPGNTFDFAQLARYVNRGAGNIPQGWTYDESAQILTAKNGVRVVKGFCQFILNAASWDGDNVPQEEEYRADPAILHGPSVGAGSRQVFRDGFLWWTAANGVIWERWLGLELDAAYKQIAALATQSNPAAAITTLQTLQNTVDGAFTNALAKLGAK